MKIQVKNSENTKIFFACGALDNIPTTFATSGGIFGGILVNFHFRQSEKKALLGRSHC